MKNCKIVQNKNGKIGNQLTNSQTISINLHARFVSVITMTPFGKASTASRLTWKNLFQTSYSCKCTQKNADGGLGRFVETIAKFMRSENVKAKIRQELEKKLPTKEDTK